MRIPARLDHRGFGRTEATRWLLVSDYMADLDAGSIDFAGCAGRSGWPQHGRQHRESILRRAT